MIWPGRTVRATVSPSYGITICLLNFTAKPVIWCDARHVGLIVKRHDPDISAANVIPEQLLAACYADMRRIARSLMARDGVARYLQPTELVNEAAIRLLRSNLDGVADEGHMLAYAARTMRQVLISEARKTMASKRQPVTMLTFLPDTGSSRLIDLEALDRALAALADYSPEHARIVELRYMLGLSLAEIVTATGLAQRTVTRRWQAARLWLLEHIEQDLAD
jgi:RNA polymerase sigma factor (TIGR02999 family)